MFMVYSLTDGFQAKLSRLNGPAPARLPTQRAVQPSRQGCSSGGDGSINGPFRPPLPIDASNQYLGIVARGRSTPRRLDSRTNGIGQASQGDGHVWRPAEWTRPALLNRPGYHRSNQANFLAEPRKRSDARADCESVPICARTFAGFVRYKGMPPGTYRNGLKRLSLS